VSYEGLSLTDAARHREPIFSLASGTTAVGRLYCGDAATSPHVQFSRERPGRVSVHRRDRSRNKIRRDSTRPTKPSAMNAIQADRDDIVSDSIDGAASRSVGCRKTLHARSRTRGGGGGVGGGEDSRSSGSTCPSTFSVNQLITRSDRSSHPRVGIALDRSIGPSTSKSIRGDERSATASAAIMAGA